MKAMISTLFVALGVLATATAAAATISDLQDNAPDRYVVVPGDTLWGISGRYLKSPWKWPELWKANQQVRNPNLIYPGDILVLDRSGSDVSLRLGGSGTVSLTPQVRTEVLPPEPIPVIPLTDIAPFLSQPRIVEENELQSGPRVVATQENRLTAGDDNVIYAKDLAPNVDYWQLLRRDTPLIDPDSKEPLGWLAAYLADAHVVERGPVSVLRLTSVKREVQFGDGLVPAPRVELAENFFPHAPSTPVSGKVIKTYENLYETGPLRIVAISRGARDGLRIGDVLALRRNPASRTSVRQAPLYGRLGPTGDPTPNEYRQAPLSDRNGPLYGYYGPSGKSVPNTAVRVPVNEIPDFRYGLVMVFKTFEKVSFALVMETSLQVDLYDIVTNP